MCGKTSFSDGGTGRSGRLSFVSSVFRGSYRKGSGTDLRVQQENDCQPEKEDSERIESKVEKDGDRGRLLLIY